MCPLARGKWIRKGNEKGRRLMGHLGTRGLCSGVLGVRRKKREEKGG